MRALRSRQHQGATAPVVQRNRIWYRELLCLGRRIPYGADQTKYCLQSLMLFSKKTFAAVSHTVLESPKEHTDLMILYRSQNRAGPWD